MRTLPFIEAHEATRTLRFDTRTDEQIAQRLRSRWAMLDYTSIAFAACPRWPEVVQAAHAGEWETVYGIWLEQAQGYLETISSAAPQAVESSRGLLANLVADVFLDVTVEQCLEDLCG